MATNRRLLSFSADQGYEEEVLTTDTVQLPKVVFTGISGVAVDAGGFLISNIANPVSAGDAVNKGYADAISQGITQIPSVRVMASSQQTLSGLPTIDGVTLIAGDRVLLTAQANNPVANGVWVVGTGAWKRPSGSNGVSDYTTGRAASGLAMFVREGTAFADQGYVCITDGGPIIDTNAVAFTQYTGLGEVVTGAGLIKQAASGNQIAINLAPNSGFQFTNSALDSLLDPAGALAKSAAGLAIKPNTNNTVAVDASGLRTLGLPSLFTVAGNAVDANVTASNLNNLVDGPTVQADGLHTHLSVMRAQAVVDTHPNGSTALSVGDAVYWSTAGNALARGDAAATASANVIGIVGAATAASSNATVFKQGVIKSVATGLTPGGQVFLAVGGGLTQSVPTAAGATLVSLGIAVNSTDVDVTVKYIGRRASS